MPLSFTTVPDFLAHGFDALIDVRSPAEFSEDHVPGAINLPVLDNEERARVGTIYKQESPFRARKIGAALVFRNAAAHVEGPLAGHDGSWRPLVYCWRGGQRSGTLAWMLREIGWRADTVQGGYRTWRRAVNKMLYDDPLPYTLVLIDGNTGTAKTDLLGHLASAGQQVLDLEGLANHRGSLLGARTTPQPDQKMFESGIAAALARFDPKRPVLVEAESSKIGSRIVPPALWQAMTDSPRIEVQAPIEARARYLAEAYDDILSDGPRLAGLLDHLRPVRGHGVVDRWHALIAAGDKVALTAALMEDHYDPAYRRARKRHGAALMASLRTDRLDASGLALFAERIVAEIERNAALRAAG